MRMTSSKHMYHWPVGEEIHIYDITYVKNILGLSTDQLQSDKHIIILSASHYVPSFLVRRTAFSSP